MTLTGFDHAALTVLSYLAEAAARGLVLAIVAGAALALLRVRSSAARLWTWTLVLYAALAMPALEYLMPRVPLPFAMPAAFQAQATTAVASIAEKVTIAAPEHVVATGTSTVLTDNSRVSWSRVAIVIYAAVALFLLTRMLAGWIVTNRLHRNARPIADVSARGSLARLARERGLSRPPRLADHPELFVPVTVGVLHPTIVLPADWPGWTANKLDVVLAHEMAHVVNHDTRTLWMSHVNRVVFWFSPLSWWLHSRLTQLMEQANDEATLAAGVSQTDYAETLLDFFSHVRHESGRAAWHLAMASRGTDASRRVERILEWTTSDNARASMTRSMLVIIAVLTVPAIGLAAALGPTRFDAVTPPPAAHVGAPPQTSPTPSPKPSPSPTPKPSPKPSPSAKPSPSPKASPKPSPQASGVPSPVPTPFGEGAYKPGNGVTWPTVVYEAKPKYTRPAMQAKLEGTVELEIVVKTDGTVSDVRVTKSLDTWSGLDDAAVDAAKRWKFEPGTLNGNAVPTIVGLVLEFRLH